MSRSLSLVVAGAVALASPLSAFAATAATRVAAPATMSISAEDILNAVDPATTEPIVAPSPSMPADGKGGGMMNSSLYYPGGMGAGVQVSADITKSVTPDFIAINAYCDSGKQPSRQAVRDVLNAIYADIKNMVGKDGRVRKSGAVTAYPYYDQTTGASTESFNGSLSVFVKISNKARAQAINDYIEQKNCSVNWDVRLVNTQAHELSILDELAKQLNTRKAVFEKLLNKKLNTISSASLSTWVDSYGTYDPDTDTVDATTSLSVSFDLGGRTTISPIRPLTK